MTRTFIIIAATVGFLGVAIGAFGAHGLAAHFADNPDLEPTFQTASDYHLIHALALLGVAWAAERYPGRAIRWAGYLMLAGVVVFSGSLYILSIANIRWLGAIAPLGGTALLAGWLLLGVAAWRGEKSNPNA